MNKLLGVATDDRFAFESMVGRKIDFRTTYTDLSSGNLAHLQGLPSPVLVATLEPWHGVGYASTDGPIAIRYGHEFNGRGWYPWQTDALTYVRDYHRVVDNIRCHNPQARFVWSPNVIYPGSAPLADFWPGENYVDAVGIDGYCWPQGVAGGFKWPHELFDPTIAAVQKITHKPIYLAEVACAERSTPTSKAYWIETFFDWLKTAPVYGFSWFEFKKVEAAVNRSIDWRVGSSPASLEAFRKGIA